MLERRHPLVELELSQIKFYVEPYVRDMVITAELMSTGLSNTNYHITTKNNKHYLFRIHNETKTAIKEYKLTQQLQYLTDKIPTTLYFLPNAINNNTCSVIEFIHGKPLSDSTIALNYVHLYKQLAYFLACMVNFQFTILGELDTELNIKPFLTEEKAHHPYVNFMLDCLNSNCIKNNVPAILLDSCRKFILKHEHIINSIIGLRPHIVHGDFKKENILVYVDNNQLGLAGVVDWEYARSDIIYADIATLFRGYYPDKDDEISAVFFQELDKHNISLVSNWLQISKYIDLINLLAFLDSSKPRATLYKYILLTLKETMAYIDNG